MPLGAGPGAVLVVIDGRGLEDDMLWCFLSNDSVLQMREMI